MTTKSGKGSGGGAEPSREERLKEALRANLRRRKAAARRQSAAKSAPDGTDLPNSADKSPK